ncbi:hypothetical protein C8N30_2650 [Sulfitobacter guttiformis]|uniref:CopL family metal-binding regulatory protein n=1 Tax=Sulfitobacter guttiformis TaxID=74349 RepID=A0A420DH93_9RHOB|nr:hypothetical protein C8N30_2650 [Sulfitobacter guttiformis]
MTLRGSTIALLKTFACAAFAFALVLLPPSASHASSNMHDSHHTVSDRADHSGMDHGAAAVTQPECGALASSDGKDHVGGKCCSGICSSVVLGEAATVFARQSTSGRYLPLNPQMNSVEQSGFLRPPQFLI